MKIVSNPTEVEIKITARALKEGFLVAFPTETVYGLGANAINEIAVGRIYEVKGRPTDHPLIVHVSSINQLMKWVIDIPNYAMKLARDFWPGPMTLILKRSNFARDFITGGQDYVGVRIPSHPAALKLLSEFEKLGGIGVAAPSANRFGAVSPTTAKAVCTELGEYLDSNDVVLDGGSSKIGIESTIIDCKDATPSILRPGAITRHMVENSCKLSASFLKTLNSPRVSGVFQTHYAPKAQVIVDGTPIKGDGLIALKKFKTPEGVIRLASPRNSNEYAALLYSAFREADYKGLKKIVALTPEGNGIELAIWDRLNKSSSSRN